MKKSAPKNSSPKTNLPPLDQLAHEREISRRAYELWEAAGGHHGDDLRHWLAAEREVQARSESAK